MKTCVFHTQTKCLGNNCGCWVYREEFVPEKGSCALEAIADALLEIAKNTR